jgi:dTDP-4-dehydrorhamnose 3,5-epimerase
VIITPTLLDGIFTIQYKKNVDSRGSFVKTFHEESFFKFGLKTNFKESFYSISKRNVLRGMHFQAPPHSHAKLIYVVKGEILDVALDIRKDSLTFGQVFSTVISSNNCKAIYIEEGFAHGFLTLSNEAIVVYSASSMYAPEYDKGIHWNSFGFDWNLDDKPTVSLRDANFLPLK